MEAVKKVLVVDDDPVVGKSVERVLGSQGYAVICAADGQSALDKLQREDYDMVYADIKMPGMSGLDVAERVRAHQPWLPVVIITGYGSQANEARAKAAGVAAFLRKPLSPEMIEWSAHEALQSAAGAARPTEVTWVPQAAVTPPAAAPEAKASPALRFAKNVGLFVAAPFIGLAYAVALPFIGIGLIAWTGYEALAKRKGGK